ncbi:MAG TPA: SRPBCC family protein [Anaerolineae bacterium]|jgi:uncharacterized protein YndB with AHSA1/START domain
MAKFERKEGITATPERVWQVLTDLNAWKDWFPDLTSVASIVPLTEGATFSYQNGAETGTATVTRAEVNHALEVATEIKGRKTKHSFLLSPKGGLLGMGGKDTWLEYDMEYDPGAGIIGNFISSGNPVDLMKLKNALDKVEDISEHHSDKQ